MMISTRTSTAQEICFCVVMREYTSNKVALQNDSAWGGLEGQFYFVLEIRPPYIVVRQAIRVDADIGFVCSGAWCENDHHRTKGNESL